MVFTRYPHATEVLLALPDHLRVAGSLVCLFIRD